MVNVEKYTKFPTLNAIKAWAKTNEVRYIDDLPYVQKDGQFYYFSNSQNVYNLLMTSSRDLQEAQA